MSLLQKLLQSVAPTQTHKVIRMKPILRIVKVAVAVVEMEMKPLKRNDFGNGKRTNYVSKKVKKKKKIIRAVLLLGKSLLRLHYINN